MSIYFYITLTSIAMLAKLGAFFIIRSNWRKTSSHYLALLLTFVLIIHSLLEFYSCLPSFREHPAGLNRGMRGYYICFILFATIIPYIALAATRESIPKYLSWIILPYSLLVIFLLAFTDCIISDVIALGFTYTAKKESFYFLFLLAVFLSTGYTSYILKKKKSNENSFLYVKSKNIFIAFLPFGIIITSGLIAMQLGAKINILGILPISIGIFALAIAHNTCRNSIIDYSYWIPFSKRRRQLHQLIRPFICAQYDGLDPELRKEYSRLLSQYALELFNGNQTEAAEWLKLSRAGISQNPDRD